MYCRDRARMVTIVQSAHREDPHPRPRADPCQARRRPLYARDHWRPRGVPSRPCSDRPRPHRRRQRCNADRDGRSRPEAPDSARPHRRRRRSPRWSRRCSCSETPDPVPPRRRTAGPAGAAGAAGAAGTRWYRTDRGGRSRSEMTDPARPHRRTAGAAPTKTGVHARR